MKFFTAFLFLFISSFNLVICQDDDYVVEEEEQEDKKTLKDKFIIDTNLALQFGTYTLIGANPQVGVQVSPKFVVGLGYSYFVSTFKPINQPRITDQLHGPTVYGRFLLGESFFARTDYQWMNYILDTGSDVPDTFDRNRWFIGAGYRACVSSKTCLTSGIYIDLLDPNPTRQPVFRTGIEVALGGWRNN